MIRKRADRTPGDREALLRAVCERPEDDAPRLRYAECLEATGDPNDALRAEFIRVQCELARLEVSDDRWLELQERKAAFDAYCDRWADELPKLDGVRWNAIDFRRGFVWDVWCDDAEAFRRHAPTIFASAPVQSLSFMRLRSLRPVVEVPEFSRITRLILDNFRLGPAEAQTLAESQSAGNLTALHLSGNRFGDAGAKALAASPRLRQLDDLDLGHNRIGDDGVAALAGSLVVATLSHLGLAGNPLTNVGALALATSPFLNRLTGMTLWECKKIGAKGKEALKARFGATVSFED
jgi:uncharacterized protein (TIGR02996 family)